ncbi:MAG: SCO6880 family protein [Nocardioides sp.]
MTVYGASATRDRHGFFFGLTGVQVLLVGGAGFPVWLAMAVGEWLAVLVLVPAWALVSGLVCVPIRGWSAAQWIGVLGRHFLGRATGWTRWQSRAAAGEIDDPGEADLPGVLASITIHDGPPLSGTTTRPAVIQNRATRTWAVTGRIGHRGIGMADEQERFRMGGGLAELLEGASASNQIHLIAVQVRTVPDDGTERAHWVRQHGRGDEPALSGLIHAQIDEAMQAAAVRTEAFVTVVAREETIGKDAKRAGRGVLGRARVLYGLLGEVQSRLLGGIGCTSVHWLDSSELATAIRTGFEPGDAPALADAALHHARNEAIPPGVPVAAAGPTTASTALRSYSHGEWQSISTTILLPRKGAVMGALAGALVPSEMGERRSLTVFYRPVSAQHADRRTGRAEMSAAMGAEMRRKVGKLERAKERAVHQHLRETDEKLERGRSMVHASSVLSVTIPATWSGHDFARRLDASVRLCGFTPLPLDGAHDAAFAAATIPLGTGLPRGRRGTK